MPAARLKAIDAPPGGGLQSERGGGFPLPPAAYVLSKPVIGLHLQEDLNRRLGSLPAAQQSPKPTPPAPSGLVAQHGATTGETGGRPIIASLLTAAADCLTSTWSRLWNRPALIGQPLTGGHQGEGRHWTRALDKSTNG